MQVYIENGEKSPYPLYFKIIFDNSLVIDFSQLQNDIAMVTNLGIGQNCKVNRYEMNRLRKDQLPVIVNFVGSRKDEISFWKKIISYVNSCFMLAYKICMFYIVY